MKKTPNADRHEAQRYWLNHYFDWEVDRLEPIASSKPRENVEARFPSSSAGYVVGSGPEFDAEIDAFCGEFPQVVPAARAHVARMALFEGRGWNEASAKKHLRVGSVPKRIMDYDDQRPPNVTPDLIEKVVSWASQDQTQTGRGLGLGLVGQFGTGKLAAAVWAVFEMFERFPFLESDRSSLAEPRMRAASCFRAGEIVRAFAGIRTPNDSFQHAVSRGILEDCRHSEVLVIADLGDIPMSASESREFLEILDDRKADGAPTVWTSQCRSTDLEKRFFSRFGRLIVQRLSYDTQVIVLD